MLGGSVAGKPQFVSDMVYQLKVQLNHVRPEIWRRVLVRSSMTLDRIHSVIQAAMGWQNSHLHQFIADGKTYTAPDPDFDRDAQSESDVPIGTLLSSPGQSLVYEYDFGDGWEHEVTLEEVLSGTGDLVLPVCLEGQRACPPEDVGGPHGYREFLQAYVDSQHPDHEEMLDWAGADFDPDTFDVELANSILSADR